MLAGFPMRTVRSTTETSGVGTRKAMPVSLPFTAGMTFPTALAAPVPDGMMFAEAQRPPRQSLPPRLGPSTVNCVAVMACTVVIKPSTTPKLSLSTFVSGAKQFVVQDALETTVSVLLYSVWFTPTTYMGTASLGGAEMMTFWAPPLMCNSAFSFCVNTPVDSQTNFAPVSPHGICVGSFSWKTAIGLPHTIRNSLPPSVLISTVPLNGPWTESYCNW
mmetsp:Transcript_94596/g.173371  ORF Transcript_94596/g.173371 Transcript_94596/m.173371 type:complete len:218 (+) Transcript_94596:83-736(+)